MSDLNAESKPQVEIEVTVIRASGETVPLGLVASSKWWKKPQVWRAQRRIRKANRQVQR